MPIVKKKKDYIRCTYIDTEQEYNENKYAEANTLLSESYTYFEEDTFKEEQETITSHLPVELITLKPTSKSKKKKKWSTFFAILH